MALALVIVGCILIAAAAALALFGRWLSNSRTVIEDEDPHEPLGDRSLWQRLAGLVGRGPRRLTYRRDERGRFRKHRR
jgi:hypothetical protein